MKFASKLRETTQKRMLELQEKSSSPWADVTFLEAAIEVLLEVGGGLFVHVLWRRPPPFPRCRGHASARSCARRFCTTRTDPRAHAVPRKHGAAFPHPLHTGTV
jgi:hypothetical protein